jgi:alanine dehydrogenase
MAAGWARRSVILDLSLERLRYLSDVMPANVQLISLQPPQHPRADQRRPTWWWAACSFPVPRRRELIRREDLATMRPAR